ncbi:MAG: cobalamin B12-binding domain-containing protein [Eubacteriales bacterium]
MSRDLVKAAKDAVINGDEEAAAAVANEAISSGIDLFRLIDDGLTAGMTDIGEQFAKEEISLPYVMIAAQAMTTAMDILEPHLPVKEGKKGKVIIGTIEGDIHDIGKSIVATMLRINGFEVFDLGRDVPVETFIEKAGEMDADIIATSTLMTTTMMGQKLIEEKLSAAGLRAKVKTMVGGAPVNKEWAQRIGADAYGENAMDAVAMANELLL